ncbi:MAG: TetR/AcrR family transcriptional regulator [Sphingorhabdus sp.]
MNKTKRRTISDVQTKSGKKKVAHRSSREAKRIELLNEAAKTLNRLGVSQTSLASIAKSVGISRAALYYYVDNQEDLVYQSYVRTCQQLSGLLNAAATQHEHALEIIGAFIASTLDDDRAELASLSDVAFLKEEKLSVVLGLYKGLRSSLSDIIAIGIERKEVRACDPHIVASILIGLITWAPVVLMWRPVGGTPKEDLSRTIQEIIRMGIATDREAAISLERFDLLPFVAIKGNVFDAEFRNASRKETLVASASWLFNQKGVDATSLEEVALRVGVTKKVIYHNMGSKDDLVAECYRRGFRFSEFIFDATKNSTGPRINALCNSLATLAEASVRPDIAPFAPITGLDAWKDNVREELLNFAGKLVKDYDKMLHEGMDEGNIREINTHALVALYPGFYEWMPRWIDTFQAAERQKIPNEIANFLRLGLGAI